MDYTLEDLAKAAEILKDKCFGKKDEYTISFTKEDDNCRCKSCKVGEGKEG